MTTKSLPGQNCMHRARPVQTAHHNPVWQGNCCGCGTWWQGNCIQQMLLTVMGVVKSSRSRRSFILSFSGSLKFTVRRHTFNNGSLSSRAIAAGAVPGGAGLAGCWKRWVVYVVMLTVVGQLLMLTVMGVRHGDCSGCCTWWLAQSAIADRGSVRSHGERR